MTPTECPAFDSETILKLAKAYDRALGEVDRTLLGGDPGRAGVVRHGLAREIFSLGRQRAAGTLRPDGPASRRAR